MGKNLIIANWKMNPKNAKEAQSLFDAVKAGVRNIKNIQVIICPPAIWLPIFKSSAIIKLGAQNCHWETSGAYTGEISANMLADAGAEYVILGHSERRQFMGETDEIVNLKIKTALKVKLKPILCVGERAGEEMGLVIESQLTNALAGLGVNQVKEIIAAYEPIWAIGTGDHCLPDSALSAGLFIKKTITKLYSRFLADKIPVLYGGSVDAQNNRVYISQAHLDGLLVGGASLVTEEFVNIIRKINAQ